MTALLLLLNQMTKVPKFNFYFILLSKNDNKIKTNKIKTNKIKTNKIKTNKIKKNVENPALIIDALKDEFNVPVHVIQIDNSAKVIVERDAKFLDVDGAKEAALPVKLDAGSFVHVLQEADVDSGNDIFDCV